MQGMECIGEGDVIVQPLPAQIQLSKTFPFWSALSYSAISKNAKSRYLQFWLWIVDCSALHGGGSAPVEWWRNDPMDRPIKRGDESGPINQPTLSPNWTTPPSLGSIFLDYGSLSSAAAFALRWKGFPEKKMLNFVKIRKVRNFAFMRTFPFFWHPFQKLPNPAATKIISKLDL